MATQEIDLLGGFYQEDGREWAGQDTVNFLLEFAEVAGTRTRMKLSSAPGLRRYLDIDPAAVRGLKTVGGSLFAVAGTRLYQINTKGVATARGTIPGVGRVKMAYNQVTGGNQLLITTGQSNAYVFNTADNTFTRINDEAYPGARSAAYKDGYILQVEPFGRFFFHSELADALDYSSLDRYESEASPDKLVTVEVLDDVVAFNETTIEFFYNAGTTTGTFQNKGAVVARGCASGASVVTLDNSVMWLGDDGVVYRLDGYAAVPISTGPVQEAIRSNNWAQSFAFKWEGDRHKVYYLTFPDGKTWGYDVVTRMWHRRQSYGMDRWRLNDLVYWNGMWIGGDFQTGTLWVLDPEYMLEGDDPIVRERITQPMAASQNEFFVSSLELLVRTGAGSLTAAQPSLDISGVTLIPSTGNFAYSTVPHLRVVDGEQPVLENRHAGTSSTDVMVALDQLFATFPTCETVSLVVSWFGDDLRAGQCQIRPRLAVAPSIADRVSWTPSNWAVEQVTPTTATLVTYVNNSAGGYSVYGSTPSDDSIVQVIQYLKSKGKRVVFYPFLLMDVPTGNTLPNPWGGASQPVNPWRGRVTCYPAPGVSGSPDATAAAGTQIDTFFTREWGFLRFVRHYIALCAPLFHAGDVFIVGTEMVGITQVRSSRTAYPAVAHLRQLAANAKAAMPQVLVSYAADWTEYHSRQYSNGDLNFHLDPLWADANVDFVGIDNYFPIADVRTDDNPELVHSVPYLKSNIEGGELYDWYYVDRAAGTRAPISDGGYNKPWVYRQKDMRGWWSNAHVTRQAYVETTQTAWVPGSKPIWFTEYGCAAINRGPNQPNVFFDPNSSESTLPYFSNGVRDDAAQRAYYEATISYWREHGGSMISTANMIAWTWDARPYPQFPSLTEEWGDYGNYPRGHWLQGRFRAQAEMPDRAIEVCYSDDGGNNWTNWRRKELGGVGEYSKRIRMTRLGSSYSRVWRIRCSSPLPVELHGAVAQIEVKA